MGAITTRSAREDIGMEASEQLRRYCINDSRLTDADPLAAPGIDGHTGALVLLAAMICTRAPGACFRPAIDDAVAAGVSLDEMVAVVVACRPIVGLPSTVAAAQQIAMALGVADDLLADTEP
jgi:alkylhydroperoxidase/carboxymuconolactone decarboxylase family protein YurZ